MDLLQLVAVAACIVFSTGASSEALATWATVASIPEVQGGPTCCLFDSPFTGVRSTRIVSYTSNSESYVWSIGNISNFSSILNPPQSDTLGPDPSPAKFSHCGKWLNAAWAEDENSNNTNPTGIVHGYYHQEWQCDYANGGYTNKSIGYAVSRDGGLTFVPEPDNNQIISASNFSKTHQTGEGDHGVVRIGNFLYLFFLEWDGFDGGVTVGLARSRVEDKGRPGTWLKWFNSSFSEPGVGGRADLIRTCGTAAAVIEGMNAVVSIGVVFSPGPMQLASRSLRDDSSPPVDNWAPAPGGPLFTADFGSWNRLPSSGELFAYPSIVGPEGNDRPIPSNAAYAYFTYLAPGATFAERYLVRRRTVFYSSIGSAMLPSLALLTLWCNTTCTSGTWATTGPVLGFGWSTSQGLYKAHQSVALLLTEELAAPNSSIRLLECQDTATGRVALMHSCADAGVKYLRTAGWLVSSLKAASSIAWVATGALQPTEGLVYRANADQLWRCIGTGAFNYSVALGESGSSCSPFAPDELLGFAFSLLLPTARR